jgi:hypothetical protein
MGEVYPNDSHFPCQYYSISAPYYSSSTKLFVLLLSSSIGLTSATADGKKEGTRRQRSRRMQLLDDFKEKRNYWNLKPEALDRTVWRIRFERVYVPFARESAKFMKE